MGKKPRNKTLSPADWENRTDDEILAIRVRDLGLQIRGTALETCIGRLYSELEDSGIKFRPGCYLADEWLCPDKVPIIGIPFCLAHPRLKRIEQKMMLEVEGGTEEECMKLLRHECGHAINYAYYLYKRTRWRQLFGPFTAEYKSSYPAKPYSRRYVMHLADNYAQCHPDEDFAETFAVWLTPESNWHEKYKNWPAMKKLQYVDNLALKIGDVPPENTARDKPWSAARMTSTLAVHYERKRKHLGDDFPGYYDPSLLALFGPSRDGATPVKAAAFLRSHRRYIVSSVSRWTGQRKYDISQLLGKLIRRCRALDLHVRTSENETMIAVTSFVTAAASKVLKHEDANQRK